jgi:hypothetical protein
LSGHLDYLKARLRGDRSFAEHTVAREGANLRSWQPPLTIAEIDEAVRSARASLEPAPPVSEPVVPAVAAPVPVPAAATPPTRPAMPIRSHSRIERADIFGRPQPVRWAAAASLASRPPEPRRAYVVAGYILCLATVGVWVSIVALLRDAWYPDFSFSDADFWSPGDDIPEKVAILIPTSRPLVVVPVASVLVSAIAGWIAAIPLVNRALVEAKEELFLALFHLVALSSVVAAVVFGFMIVQPELSLLWILLIPWVLFLGLFVAAVMMVLMFVPFAIGIWAPGAFGFAGSHWIACALLKPPHRIRLLR